MIKIEFHSKGPGGNIFSIIAQVITTCNLDDNTKNTMIEEVCNSSSYENALKILNKYAKLIDKDGVYKFI